MGYNEFVRTIRRVSQPPIGHTVCPATRGRYPDEIGSATVIAITTGLMIFVGVFLGFGFSLGIDRLQLDPAAGSAPLVTAVADMTGITLLCTLAFALLAVQPEGTSVPSYCTKVARCPGYEDCVSQEQNLLANSTVMPFLRSVRVP